MLSLILRIVIGHFAHFRLVHFSVRGARFRENSKKNFCLVADSFPLIFFVNNKVVPHAILIVGRILSVQKVAFVVQFDHFQDAQFQRIVSSAQGFPIWYCHF